MKQSRHMIVIIGVFVLLVCLSNSAALAKGASDTSQFPDGVIVVPQGTSILIDDDSGTVTISDCPVEIAAGKTFIVYLQDLPIGYTAQSVSYNGNDTIIETEKADRSVYANLEEEGEVFLTSDMYEFIPARNASYSVLRSSGPSYGISDPLNFQDGKLTVTVMRMNGAKVQVELSGMRLTHSFSGGDVSIVLNGNWTVSTELSTEEDSLGEVQLGEMRIYGIGKIALSIDISNDMSLKYSLSGSFSAGFSTNDDGEGHIIKTLSVGQNSVEGKGSISVSLKITAGVDILVAEADVYAEIGVKTQYKTKNTYHSEWNPPRSVHCDDFKIYIFSNVGAEAKYLSASGKKKKIASVDFELIGENDSPYLLDIHFEDGQLVGGCSEGMDTTSIEMDLGGVTSSFGSTLLSGNRDRILETNVDLPWDIEVEGDYTIANGSINLNGKTLTINGDLIHAGGTITVGNGTLIVHGDYRLQSEDNGVTSDSTGMIDMSYSEGKLYIDGDLIIQTSSDRNRFNAGQISIGGDIYQKNTADNNANFITSSNLVLEMNASRPHIIRFEDASSNSVGNLRLLNNVEVQNNFILGTTSLNGNTLCVLGDLEQQYGTVSFDGGTVTITGNYTISGASLEMANEDDTVRIGGDFAVNSMYGELTAGTMYISGDFTQTRETAADFKAKSNHMIVFDGTQRQVISFNDYVRNSVANITFENPDIEFATGIPQFELNNDIDLDISAETFGISDGAWTDGTWRLNGHSLGDGRINANDTFIIEMGTIDLGGSSILIDGNLLQQNGNINLNGGTLEVTGDHTIDDASLEMANEDDTVRIGGDFTVTFMHGELTAGTMYIGGNFTQARETGADFKAKSNHLIVFDGTQRQVISFNDYVRNSVANITFENPDIEFATGIPQFELNDDIDLTITAEAFGISDGAWTDGTWRLNGHSLGDGRINANDTFILERGTIDLGGSSILIDGDLLQQNGNISLNGGTLEVTGNHTIDGARLVMANEADTVRIGGDFTVTSMYGELTAGTIYIGGNFTQTRETGADFKAKSNHRIVFNGTQRQIITFNDYVRNSVASIIFENTDIEFATGIPQFELNDDIDLIITAETFGIGYNASDGTWRLNGHSLGEGKINANEIFVFERGTIDLGGSSILIDGDLLQQNGNINLNRGTLEVTGDHTINGANLVMANEADTVRIGGDFTVTSMYKELSAGTMYIGGDFTCNGNKFANSENHNVVLNGTGNTAVTFSQESNHFGTLYITHPLDEYTFSPENCWIVLIQLSGQIFGEPDFVLPNDIATIGTSAFEGIQATTVFIPDNCTSIGAYAFRNAAVRKIRIPVGCSIGTDAFAGCESVTIFSVVGSEAEAYCSSHDNCLFALE